jgi:hypothetical protein
MGLSTNDRFFLFWSGLGALALLVIWQLPWRFQVNDDEVMMWLVSGAYTGTPENYAVFIHPILSWVLSKLYTLSPEVSWYGGLFFWTIGLSYLMLLGKIALSEESLWTKTIFTFVVLLTSLHFTIFPQFTFVAGFAAFSAIAVWFGKPNKYSGWTGFLSILVFVLAVLIRWESVVLIGIGFGLFQIVTEGRSFFSLALKKILVFSLIFLALFSFKYLWEKQSEYSDFLKFNKVRSGVIDHPVFRQEVVEGEIKPDSKLYFFSRWYFEGDSPSEKDLLEKKIELDRQFLSFEQGLKSLERLWQVQKVEVFKSFLILFYLLISLVSLWKSPRLLFFFLPWIVFFFLFNHFFLLQGRVVILFFLCFLFPVLSNFPSAIPDQFSKVAVLILTFFFGVHFYNFLQEAKGRLIMDQEFSKLRSKVETHIPIVLEGFQEHNSEINYTLYNPVPFLTTGWISRSPFQAKALRRFGLASFDEIEEYVLLSPNTNLEIVFPQYMDATFGSFEQIDSLQTDNFVFLRYSKK